MPQRPKKLTPDQVAAIKASLRAEKRPAVLSREFGVAPSTIYDIRDGLIWAWVA